jgi:hypothetical protein
MLTRQARIRELNDRLRKTGSGGRIVITAGIQALGPQVIASIVRTMAAFDEFSDDNDPYGEHDFGSFRVGCETIFFKVDLYEEPNVKDANGEPVVTRVLTIMLAEEY